MVNSVSVSVYIIPQLLCTGEYCIYTRRKSLFIEKGSEQPVIDLQDKQEGGGVRGGIGGGGTGEATAECTYLKGAPNDQK
jgi:hypothetical protein